MSTTAASSSGGGSGDGGGAAVVNHAWEDASGASMWENAVQEDEHGNIVVASGAVSLATALRNRRRRAAQNDYSLRNKRVVRDMMRYVYVLIDASRWMRQKDPVLPPGTRLAATLQLLQPFCASFYDENPLSHLGFILLKDGEAEILAPLSSTARAHKVALQSVTQMVMAEANSSSSSSKKNSNIGGGGGGGEFSLQNGLAVAGRSLGHQPRHGSREIVVLTAALSTCDPSGRILTETLPRLQAARIRVSCFALSAELHVCRRICQETGGSMGVCLDKSHFREWLLNQTVPPPATKAEAQTEPTCEMVAMGFPTRTVSEVPALVHHASREKTILARTSYTCPQCEAKHSELPTDCAVCGLKLVLSPHLARSFHHLFPVPPFSQITETKTTEKAAATAAAAAATSNGNVRNVKSVAGVALPVLPSSASLRTTPQLNGKLLVTSEDDKDSSCCMACLRPFEATAVSAGGAPASVFKKGGGGKQQQQQHVAVVEETVLLRFACPECNNYFCVDCDAFLHESVHNCPGCLSL
jgi:transcription initiation factor TFIIH subunit 2